MKTIVPIKIYFFATSITIQHFKWICLSEKKKKRKNSKHTQTNKQKKQNLKQKSEI